MRWLCEYHDLREEDVRNSLYWHQDNAAVSHLMRVASGLDSLVLGEPQILGQGQKAHADSSRDHALSSELERMFQKTFSVAKRVRTETEIGASAVSVAFAACSLARQIFESLSSVNVLLVGAGETIELVARHLREHSVRKLMIANRTRERAQLGGRSRRRSDWLADIETRPADADIIISSTASPLPIIGKGMVERALKARRNLCCWWISPCRAMLSRKWASWLTPICTAWMICRRSSSRTWRSAKRRRCRRKASWCRRAVNSWPAARAKCR